MICQETLVLLLIVALLITTLFVMYMRKHNSTKPTTSTTFKVEGFGEMSLDDLLSQYEQLTDDQKAKLSQIIGSPVNADDMIHKSAIPPQRECPASKFNELDYVKRSSIPPCPEPKPCIAPKVVVSADLCKKQDCPPCPKCQECSKVETKHVPVFVTKTIKVDEDGKELSTTVEQSDVELGENLLVTPLKPTDPTAETTVSSPEATEGSEPDGTSENIWDRIANVVGL